MRLFLLAEINPFNEIIIVIIICITVTQWQFNKEKVD